MPITGGYFVNTGLVTCLTVMNNGESVEVGLLGHEGFAGLPILLNIGQSSARFTVQIAGDAWRINADALHEILPALPMLERLLSRFAYLQALQAQQIAACNRLHDIGERLARWLLMSQDRVRLEILPLTHDLVARMLGTRRSGVTVAAGILQQAGIIEYCGRSLRRNTERRCDQRSSIATKTDVSRPEWSRSAATRKVVLCSQMCLRSVPSGRQLGS